MKPKKKPSRFDIRHKETLTLFLREYFELFFPDLARRMRFETAKFLDKELISLLDEPQNGKKRADHQAITDALILIRIVLDGRPEWILIHWEQQSERETHFERRMFRYFCGIYFKFGRTILPIAMFTDPAKWRRPISDKFTISLPGHPICEFSYTLIKLRGYKAEKLESRMAENPLAAAYLPLTDYPKRERPMIKAKAMRGVARLSKGQRQATLFSLVRESLPLNPEEHKQYQEIVRSDPLWQEVSMLESVEDVGYERGWEEGWEGGRQEGHQEGREDAVRELMKSGWLTPEQIAQIMGMDAGRVRELARDPGPTPGPKVEDGL